MNPRSFAVLLLVAAVPACSFVPRIPGVTPYRMEIQQGNFVSQEMVSQLKQGMTREQVRFILGTPMVTDIFHPDRWDYVYWREASDGKREQRKLIVFFDKGQLARLDGDVVSSAGAAR
jgi:outer membrane protein assembly factor BamE